MLRRPSLPNPTGNNQTNKNAGMADYWAFQIRIKFKVLAPGYNVLK